MDNDKMIQYLCNLIKEYWEDKEIVPKEPKKILLGWLASLQSSELGDCGMLRIMNNIRIFFLHKFEEKSSFIKFIYETVYNSEYFKLICDNLRSSEKL